MIWPFREKRQPPIGKSGLVFAEGPKGAASLFDLTCKYGDVTIEVNKGLLALVVDARKEYGTPDAVKLEPDGCQTTVLRIASEDGGFVVMSKMSGRGPMLKPDDAVLWVPFTYSEDIAKVSPDKRFGWIGLVRAKVNLPASFEDPLANITRFG